MKLQPTKTHILARFHTKKHNLIATNSKDFGELGDEYRTRVEVLAVGPDVTACKPGDFLLLVPKPQLLPVANEDEALIFESAVVGIVLDDTAA